MAVKKVSGNMDVVTAARMRVQNVFNNGLPVYFSFSGGKDSLCLAHIVFDLIQKGAINPQQLTVQFIDEEAIFPCIEKTTKEWRKKFLLAGAKFEWYCIEVRHYNCFNELANDESFICWDRTKQDVWIRQPPSFAIRTHPALNARIDTYQDFLPRISRDGITIVGIRTAESIQRLLNVASMTQAGHKITKKNQIFPIYDWSDTDVWRYLSENNVQIPDVYLYLWQSGTGKRHLRVSQFFSIDTARSLVKMNEYYPDLMDRIIRREPNAYLAALYWDSEMFGRKTKTRKQLENGSEKKDYKKELIKLLSDMDGNFQTPHKRTIAEQYRKFFMRISAFAKESDYKKMYEALSAGDPKLRNLRALYQNVYTNYIKDVTAGGKGVQQ